MANTPALLYWWPILLLFQIKDPLLFFSSGWYFRLSKVVADTPAVLYLKMILLLFYISGWYSCCSIWVADTPSALYEWLMLLLLYMSSWLSCCSLWVAYSPAALYEWLILLLLYMSGWYSCCSLWVADNPAALYQWPGQEVGHCVAGGQVCQGWPALSECPNHPIQWRLM